MAAPVLAYYIVIRCLPGRIAAVCNVGVTAEIACKVYCYQQQACHTCYQIFNVHLITTFVKPLTRSKRHPVFFQLFLFIVDGKY